ncbi:MAG: C10 family peptidase [Muribaculaceae bacterium]|nr:C10 family peptidase [Muribaculaceae bacterium]
MWLALCACLSFFAQAAPVSLEQAQTEAAAFLQQKHQGGRALKVAARANKAMTPASISAGDAAYYVFNIGNDEGFVIVSGDDRTNPILGYSDQGHFDETKAPANLKAWLAEYAWQITQLDGMEADQLEMALAAPRKAERVVETRNSIAPMVTTKWNQADPYWIKCPEFMSIDENGDTVGELTYTGCVAVSMSQVMKYHNWPPQTTKLIPSYTYSIPNEDYSYTTIEMEELPVTTFDWAHMKDSYNGSEDETSIDAVATLMYYAGAAVKSQYNVSSTGAYTDDIPKGLTEYLAYDPNTIQIKFRTDYTQEVWDNMVYQELAEGRPLIYNGTAAGYGHSFVCDGYEYGNYFHINWGWGGMGNGYFQLAVLNPRESGIGGSSSSEGYNMKQNIIIGIQPGDPSGGDTPQPQVEDALTVTGLGLYSNGYTEKTYIERDGKNYGFSIYKRQYFKLSNADHVGTQKKYDVGVALYDMDDNFISMIINRGVFSTSLTSALGSTDNLGGNIEARDAKKFGAGMTGTYKIVPMYMLEGTSEWKPMLESDRYYQVIEMSNYSATLTSHPILGLNVEGMEFEGGEKVGSQERIHVTLKNNSSDRFFGDLYLRFGNQQMDEMSQYTTSIQAEVLAGETATVTFNVTPANSGTQTLRLYYDANCEQAVSGSGSVTIAPQVVSTMDLSVEIEAENAVDGDIFDSHAHFRVDITNNGEGEYNKFVLAPLFIVDIDMETGKISGSMITYSQSALQLQPGETKTLYFDFDDLAYGRLYSLNIYARNENDQLVNLVKSGGSKLYEIRRGLVTWDGTSMVGTGVQASGDITVPANALAARLEGLDITNVTPSGNPNTIYFIGENEEIPAGLEGLNVVKGNVAENIALTVGYGYFIPQSLTAQAISYERTFAQALQDGIAENWSTIVLPFAPAACTANGSDMWIERFAQEEDGVAVFSEVETMEANVPYIIAINKAAGLTGTPITWSANDVLLRT